MLRHEDGRCHLCLSEKAVSSNCLPIQNRTVLGSNRSRMHYLLSERVLFGLFFVNLDSQPRGLCRKPITILGVEVTSNDIPTPRYIRQHVFLDQKIWRGESKMECNCIRDWPQRVMRGDSHLVGLCHGRDF